MKTQSVQEMIEHLKIVSQYILSDKTMYSPEQAISSLRALGTSLDTLMEEAKEEEKNQKDLDGYLNEWEKLNGIEQPPTLINLLD